MMRMMRMKSDYAPEDILAYAKAIAENIIARNYRGYKVRIGEDWFEINVCACEPLDTEKEIVDVDL